MDELLHQITKQSITASFALTGVNEKDTTDTLLKCVDEALYEAKESGKNRIVVR